MAHSEDEDWGLATDGLKLRSILADEQAKASADRSPALEEGRGEVSAGPSSWMSRFSKVLTFNSRPGSGSDMKPPSTRRDGESKSDSTRRTQSSPSDIDLSPTVSPGKFLVIRKSDRVFSFETDSLPFSKGKLTQPIPSR